MEKLKRFIDCYIPTETCNFRCHYCYIAQKRKYNNKLMKLTKDSDTIVHALSKKRLGGICMFNLCAGGETLLSNDIIPLTKALLEEGHYVMIVTNGSLTKRFEEIASFPSKLLKHLFFKFSFHYMELKRLNLLNTYVKNINMMKESGASYTIEITPSDELEPYINEIKEFSIKNFGALPHITVGRKDIEGIPPLTNHSFDDYKQIWNQFDSDLFKFKSDIFGIKRNEFCYAGDWSVYLNIETGDIRQCYCGAIIDNIYEKIDKPIKFLAIGTGCREPHCYNGHAFLTFGDIPELNTPTYDIMRDRKCLDGSTWLNPEMRTMMKCKLADNNTELNSREKRKNALKNKKISVISFAKKAKNKIKGKLSRR